MKRPIDFKKENYLLRFCLKRMLMLMEAKGGFDRYYWVVEAKSLLKKRIRK